MSVISDSLRSELRDAEYSEGYAESFLNSYVATQIKVIREQRQMTQSDLAREMGTTQTAISRIENVNYSSWNVSTLKKLARAFHIRLKVSFETFGTLPYEVEDFNREFLQRARREDDPQLLERRGPTREAGITREAMSAAVGSSSRNEPPSKPIPTLPTPALPFVVPRDYQGGLNATIGGLTSSNPGLR